MIDTETSSKFHLQTICSTKFGWLFAFYFIIWENTTCFFNHRQIHGAVVTWRCGFWQEMTSNFHSSGLNKDSYARLQVIAWVTNACHLILNANHWHCLWDIPAIIGIKSNITTFNYVCRFIVNTFYCGRILFKGLKDTNMVWGCASRAQPPFTAWRNSGSRTRNASRFEHYFRVLRGEY